MFRLALLALALSSSILACTPIEKTRDAREIPKGAVEVYAPLRLPPGFDDGGGSGGNGVIWDPSNGQCSVVYPQGLSLPLRYRVPNPDRPGFITEPNWFFYFPREQVLLGFIDPKATRSWEKYSWDGHHSYSVDFSSYPGGFPPGFAVLGPMDMLNGALTTPTPGDNFAMRLVSQWPFIVRNPNQTNVPQYCSFNKSCYCIR